MKGPCCAICKVGSINCDGNGWNPFKNLLTCFWITSTASSTTAAPRYVSEWWKPSTATSKPFLEGAVVTRISAIYCSRPNAWRSPRPNSSFFRKPPKMRVSTNSCAEPYFLLGRFLFPGQKLSTNRSLSLSLLPIYFILPVIPDSVYSCSRAYHENRVQLAELNGKISSIGLQPSGSPLPERQGASAAVLRSIGTQELQEWSPTQEDVDAYLDSLEHEVSEESVLMRQCQGEERKAAATTKARHSNGPVLFWCAMAAAIACLGWWLQIIYDSPK